MKNTIRVERAKKRLTQEELAKEVGVSRQTIHSIENEKFEPTLHTAAKISRFFKLRIEEIFKF
jgi:putative transcriptional regulator